MARIVIDESRWPIVLTALPAEFSDADWQSFFERSHALFERHTPFAFINETRGGQTPNAEQRGLFSTSFRTNRALIARYLVANAMIVNSLILRAAVSAMLWVQAPPFPIRVFHNEVGAEIWVKALLSNRVRVAV